MVEILSGGGPRYVSVRYQIRSGLTVVAADGTRAWTNPIWLA
jgi:hypothetical protein